MAAAAPEVARDGIRLRQIGQQIIEILGGKRIHPAWVVPGGVSAPLTEEKRDQIQAMLPDAHRRARTHARALSRLFQRFPEEMASFANFPSLFLGTDRRRRQAGILRRAAARSSDADGSVVADELRPEDYPKYLGEVSGDRIRT